MLLQSLLTRAAIADVEGFLLTPGVVADTGGYYRYRGLLLMLGVADTVVIINAGVIVECD
jgi:hypothetical protein